MAEPLLNDHGIGSIIIESPFCILLSTQLKTRETVLPFIQSVKVSHILMNFIGS